MSSRLDQIEAASVDAEMTALLKEKLVDMFSLMKLPVCVAQHSVYTYEIAVGFIVSPKLSGY